MNSVFCCGWECGAFGAHFGNNSPADSISTANPRTGNRHLRIAPSAQTGWSGVVVGSGSDPVLQAGSDQIVVRVYVYFNTLPDADSGLVTVGNVGVGAYFKQSDSKIYCGNIVGGVPTPSGANGVSVTTGQWYRIDVSVDQRANPHIVNVQVNGNACSQLTVAVIATTTVVFRLGDASQNRSFSIDFDDYVLSFSLADYPIGAGYVNHFVPTSDGTHNVAGTADFRRSLTGTDILNSTTDAYLLVDDVPIEGGTPSDFINLLAPPNATDYVEVKYGPAPGVATPTIAPRAVEVITVSAAAGTTTNNLRLAVVDNATTSDVRNSTVGSTTCLSIMKHYSTPPSGGTWNLAGSGNGAFNNLRIRCYSSDANPDPYFVCTMIEAEFSAPKSLVPHLPQPTPNRVQLYQQKRRFIST